MRKLLVIGVFGAVALSLATAAGAEPPPPSLPLPQADVEMVFEDSPADPAEDARIDRELARHRVRARWGLAQEALARAQGQGCSEWTSPAVLGLGDRALAAGRAFGALLLLLAPVAAFLGMVTMLHRRRRTLPPR